MKLNRNLFKIGVGVLASLLFSTCLNCSKQVFETYATISENKSVKTADEVLDAISISSVGAKGNFEGYSSDVIDSVCGICKKNEDGSFDFLTAEEENEVSDEEKYKLYNIVVNGAGSYVKLDKKNLRKSCLDGVNKIKIDVKYCDNAENRYGVISSQDLKLQAKEETRLDGPHKGQTFKYKYFQFAIPKKDLTKSWYVVDIKDENNEKIGEGMLIVDWDTYNNVLNQSKPKG